jgi:hypothetical protein
MPIISCRKCSGEGRLYKSKYGGNDPDVWDAGKCEWCDGSGSAPCERCSCKNGAVGFNDDGDALCEDCLMEWASENLHL